MASDVDVAVAGDEPLPIDRRLDLASQLARALRRDVDLIDLHAAHGLLLKAVLTACTTTPRSTGCSFTSTFRPLSD